MTDVHILNNGVHLCNSCRWDYPTCEADDEGVMFGDGVGCDNICCCNKYEPIASKE